ncbi:MAG: alpha-L-rhamnosidase-related protein [Mucilaginibacter sp.]
MNNAMLNKKIYITLIFCSSIFLPAISLAKEVTISNPKISMTLSYGEKASIASLVVNGQKVISGTDGIFTSVKVGGITYSSLHLKGTPVLLKTGNIIKLVGINYGDENLAIKENWIFTITGKSIKWTLERSCSKPVAAEEAALPVFNFDSINTWEGAYQGYGGLAWFYLFNEKLCTYGVHTRSTNFWNSKTGNGLNITVIAPGNQVAMKYTRTNDDRLAYTISKSNKELLPKLDSGTNRRRFVRGRTDVWSAFTIPAGTSTQSITLSYIDVKQKYGRGEFKGIDGAEVSAVLNTIARIGVIDSLHFGGNSWHTPYGPICLHEQYIGQLGLAINDPNYLMGYQSCLDYYRDHAIKPGGRVYSRWAYTNEDAMPGKFNKYGFYEAQWGILMDSNPDLVTNIAELYDMTGDKNWVMRHQRSCEKVLDWILKRDGNGNGLVEMMTDNHDEKKSSDWIDIIWASYENAFVNAKLYHALVKWATIEHQLNNEPKAKYYADFAARLKVSFNKSTKDGGFWDEEKGCYVHWRDKDGSVHGTNMVTPVNFMAIAYGICDNDARKKTILDNIEAQMQQEKLFFWPLCMTSYAPGEGKEWQFPFPSYENGDLFLSWGSVGVKAYADYKPALAIKYVKNVLEQYSKDGLAFQRYGRVKQDGLGDDILSGNSLAIVGLYQAIYGINPLYNRFYLDPHITPDLAGTVLNYNFRGKQLVINLDSGSYSVSDKTFKVTDNARFGFNTTTNQLSYFNGNSAGVSLEAKSAQHLAIYIKNWDANKMEWHQRAHSTIAFVLHQLKPNTVYKLAINGNLVKSVRSNLKGELLIYQKPTSLAETIAISRED